MNYRNSKEFIALPILFLAFVLLLGLTIPSDALARVEYTNGSGWTEGDPGDGDETMGGGGSSGSFDPPGNLVGSKFNPAPFSFILVPFGSEFPLVIVPIEFETGFFWQFMPAENFQGRGE